MLRPKPNIEGLAVATHGGIDYPKLKRLGILPQDVIDFSVNNNPCGPPSELLDALSTVQINCYPDTNSSELRESLAEKLKLSPDNIIVTSGSTEAIRMLVTAYFEAGDHIIIPEPTYGEYALSCQIIGATIIKKYAPEKNGFKHNISDLSNLIRRYNPRGIFIGNPNNPTGHYFSKEEVRQVLEESSKCMIILDEAYLSFVENAWSSTDLIQGKNLIILRSMTKDFALAGLRLGYAVADKSIVSTLNRVKPPWNVNSFAQRAGTFVLKNDAFLQNYRSIIGQGKEFLIENLSDLGFTPVPSQTNYLLVKVGNATKLTEALLSKGILVRDCTSFGMPDYIRISVRTLDHCRILVAALNNLAL